jgi:hypothetical protein
MFSGFKVLDYIIIHKYFHNFIQGTKYFLQIVTLETSWSKSMKQKSIVIIPCNAWQKSE